MATLDRARRPFHPQCRPNHDLCKTATIRPGSWLDIKMPSYQYRKSPCGDKATVLSAQWDLLYCTGDIFILDRSQFPVFSPRTSVRQIHSTAFRKTHTSLDKCLTVTIIGNCLSMMASSSGNIFRVTGPLCGEFTINSPRKGQWRRAMMFSLIYA